MQNPLPDKHKFKESEDIFLKNHFEHYRITGLFGDAYLTSSEYFSLQMIMKGKSYKEIARVLAVSPKTIEKYLSTIKVKIGYHIRDIKFVHEFQGNVELSLCNPSLQPKKWI